MEADRDQRATLGLLLERHPRMLSVAELQDRLPDVAVPAAIGALHEDGLATRLGDLVGASRAAVRTDQLLL